MRDGSLAKAEDVIDVGLEGPVELLVGDLEDVDLALLIGGIVHQQVQAAELLDGPAHDVFAGLLGTDVSRQGDGLAAGFLDQLDHFLSVGFFGRVVVDGHIRPFPGKGDGHGAADAAVAAGDEGLAPGQATRAVIAGLAMVRTRLHLAGERRPFLALLPERLAGVFGARVLQRLGGTSRAAAFLGDGSA